MLFVTDGLNRRPEKAVANLYAVKSGGKGFSDGEKRFMDASDFSSKNRLRGLAMYKSLKLWMASKGLGNSPAKLLEEFKEIRSMDVVLPIKDHNPIRLCVVAKPDNHVQILLHRLDIKIPNRPKVVQNVVETLAV